MIWREKNGDDLAQAFRALPTNITHLGLRNNDLHLLPVEELNKLKNTLPGVHTISLSQSELDKMTAEQRAALKAVFPGIQDIIIMNKKGETLGGADLEARRYHAVKYGLSYHVNSLKFAVGFFLKSEMKPEQTTKLPQDLQNYVSQIP